MLDGLLHYLHAAALERTGAAKEGIRERERARSLGLDPDWERALAAHLGLPPPEVPTSPPEAAERTVSKAVKARSRPALRKKSGKASTAKHASPKGKRKK